MSKPPLKSSFEYANMTYELLYIPGLPADAEARYAVPPSEDGLIDGPSGAELVEIPNVGKRYAIWKMKAMPTGFTSSPRTFLFLMVSPVQHDPRAIPARSMVCYSMRPTHAQQGSPLQGIMDILFGKGPEPEIQDKGWAQEMFSAPKDDVNGGEAHAVS